MTAEEDRIARCTELAQQMWPTYPDVRVYCTRPGYASVSYADFPNSRNQLLMVQQTDRALDLLEGALLTGLGMYDGALRVRACHERIAELEYQVDRVRAWQARFGLPQNGSFELDAILDGDPPVESQVAGPHEPVEHLRSDWVEREPLESARAGYQKLRDTVPWMRGESIARPRFGPAPTGIDETTTPEQTAEQLETVESILDKRPK